ncbi:MAG: GTP cyclohydrolase, FolE2/MptA family [Nitrososphaeraceae archaeon]
MTQEHQSPTGEYNYNDYSEKMDDLIFTYDKDFYPLDEELPDPQVEPFIPGARVPLNKVGIAPVDLPIRVSRRDGTEQILQAQASLYCSLDDPNIKGLNLSRLYLLMHDKIKDHLTIDGIKGALQEMADKQGSNNAYCKLRFKYPWTQKALRSRMPLTQQEINDGLFQTLSNGEKISLRKLEGHIAYNVILEGEYHRYGRFIDSDVGYSDPNEYKFYLTVEYSYSSTCPCSFELSHNATRNRGVAANAHSQRSIMRTTIEFDPNNIVWIEDLIQLHRQHIPTETQVVVKRRDEMAFAELNGSNLLFSEDAVRIMYKALDELYDQGKIFDFRIITDHMESLHPWSAIALVTKGIPSGLK